MKMNSGKLFDCYEAIKAKIPFTPEIAIVLGSGFGGVIDSPELQIVEKLPYKDIPGCPVSTVAGHEGQYIFAKIKGVSVVFMQGRVHYYEGYEPDEVVLPVRLMILMGAKKLILSNAAGGINPSFVPGDVMLIRDQIASFVPSVLRGENDDRLGVRFPDMSKIYDRELSEIVIDCAKKLGVSLKEGIYVQLPGPAYESPAEIRMLRTLGADAVAMSTAIEAVAARHMNVRVCGMSLITNMASGVTDSVLNHEEVAEQGKRSEKFIAELLSEAICKMASVD